MQVRKTRAWVLEVEALKTSAEDGLLTMDAAVELLARYYKLPMSCALGESLDEAVEAAKV
jgi:hypothetical protein